VITAQYVQCLCSVDGGLDPIAQLPQTLGGYREYVLVVLHN
jgi:hypothetical protein